MSHIPKNLLVVGSTGWLGSQIASELAKNKNFNVKVLIRKDTLEKKKDLIDNLKSLGASISEGDVTDVDSVVQALKDVDTIVSVVGSAQVGDQFKLLEAAKKSPSVKRFVPSGYGFDLTHLGQDSLLYGKVKVDQAIQESGLDYTLISTGCFYEFLFSEGFGFDHQKGVLNLPGTGDEVMFTTHTSDIAKFVPQILLDPHSKNSSIFIQGERTTLRKAIQIFEKASGKKFEVHYHSAEDLKKKTEEAEGWAKFPPHLQYLSLFHANPKYDHSSRYTVEPISIKQYAESLYKK